MGKHFGRKKIKGGVIFSKSALKIDVAFLAESFYFNVGNITVKQMVYSLQLIGS